MGVMRGVESRWGLCEELMICPHQNDEAETYRHRQTHLGYLHLRLRQSSIDGDHRGRPNDMRGYSRGGS